MGQYHLPVSARFALGMLLGALVASFGCQSSPPDVRIGVCVVETRAPFYTLLREGMRDVAERKGAEIVWRSVKEPPPGWWKRQWQAIRGRPASVTPLSQETRIVLEMLRDGIDALVIQPVSSDKLDYLIRATQQRRVPMITLERLPFNRRVAGHTQLNARRIGEMAARFAVEKIGGRGNVIVVAGPRGNAFLRQVVIGIYQVLDRYPEALRVLEAAPEKLDPDESFGVVNTLLTRYAGNVQAVIACDTTLSVGAVRAVQTHGLESNIVTVGVGAGREACQLLKSRGQGVPSAHDMEVDLMPYEWGQRLMEAVIDLVTNEELRILPHDAMLPNGDVEVPVLYAPAREITSENLYLMERMWPDLFE